MPLLFDVYSMSRACTIHQTIHRILHKHKRVPEKEHQKVLQNEKSTLKNKIFKLRYISFWKAIQGLNSSFILLAQQTQRYWL